MCVYMYMRLFGIAKANMRCDDLTLSIHVPYEQIKPARPAKIDLWWDLC